MRHVIGCSAIVVVVIVLLLIEGRSGAAPLLCGTEAAEAQSPIATATPYVPGPPPPYYTPGWHDPVTRTPTSPLPTAPVSPLCPSPTPTRTNAVVVKNFRANNRNRVRLVAVVIAVLLSVVGIIVYARCWVSGGCAQWEENNLGTRRS